MNDIRLEYSPDDQKYYWAGWKGIQEYFSQGFPTKEAAYRARRDHKLKWRKV